MLRQNYVTIKVIKIKIEKMLMLKTVGEELLAR